MWLLLRAFSMMIYRVRGWHPSLYVYGDTECEAVVRPFMGGMGVLVLQVFFSFFKKVKMCYTNFVGFIYLFIFAKALGL